MGEKHSTETADTQQWTQEIQVKGSKASLRAKQPVLREVPQMWVETGSQWGKKHCSALQILWDSKDVPNCVWNTRKHIDGNPT